MYSVHQARIPPPPLERPQLREQDGRSFQPFQKFKTDQTSSKHLVVRGGLWVVDRWLSGVRVDWGSWLVGLVLSGALGWVGSLGLRSSAGLDGHGGLVWLAAGGGGALVLSLGDDGLALGADDSDDLLLNWKGGGVDLWVLGLGDDVLGQSRGARLALDVGDDGGLRGLVRDGLGLADGGDLERIVGDGVGLGDRLGLNVGGWDELGDGDLLWDVGGLGDSLSDGLDDGRGSLGWHIGGDGLVDGLAGAAGLAVLLRLVRRLGGTVAVVVRKRGGKAGDGEESNCELHFVGWGW